MLCSRQLGDHWQQRSAGGADRDGASVQPSALLVVSSYVANVLVALACCGGVATLLHRDQVITARAAQPPCNCRTCNCRTCCQHMHLARELVQAPHVQSRATFVVALTRC